MKIGAVWATTLLIAALAAAGCTKDKVVVQTVVPSQEVGILYDGRDSAGSFNDRSAILTATRGTVASQEFGNIVAPAFGNSLIAFSRSRQPRVVGAPWTGNADTIMVDLQNNIRFNVTFWILAGNFATQQTNAAAAVLAVNNAYTVEKAGVRIAVVTINDATANPNAATIGGGSQQQFQSLIGFNAREINVYVIGTVNGGTSNGSNFDGTPMIMLGQDALTFPQLLEHEIGHAFVLWHVDGEPGFDLWNVMWPTVSGHWLTEGQIFRMHFHPSSQINAFGLRPGQPTFVCGKPETAECPANSRRLWADNTLPPN